MENKCNWNGEIQSSYKIFVGKRIESDLLEDW